MEITQIERKTVVSGVQVKQGRLVLFDPLEAPLLPALCYKLR